VNRAPDIDGRCRSGILSNGFSPNGRRDETDQWHGRPIETPGQGTGARRALGTARAVRSSAISGPTRILSSLVLH